MRTKLVLAGLLAGLALAPAAPASAQCVQVEGLPGCVPTCPTGAYGYADRNLAGGALPDVPAPLTVECTM